MSTRRARGLILALALAVVSAGGPLFTAPGPALADDSSISYVYLRGADRYDTAVKISQAMFSAALPADAGLVLAPGETYPEALCGAPLAVAYGGPVLLTPGSGLTVGVSAEIVRLAPTRVFCVGLSDGVANAVRAAVPGATVDVIRGASGNVYDMSRKVAGALEAKVGDMSAATAIVTPGTSFPDAIGVAPLACAKLWPIVLTNNTSGPLHASALGTLADLGITKLIKVGTYAGPPAGVVALANLSGSDRYQTNCNVAEWAKAHAGLSFAHTGVATGDKFPDALACGPYLARDAGLLLLSPAAGLPGVMYGEISRNALAVTRVSFVAMLEPVVSQAKMLVGEPDLWAKVRDEAGGPGRRSGATLTYVPALKKAILFGGTKGGSLRNDTWVYDPGANSWFKLSPAGSPPGSFGHAAALDPVSGKVIVVMGEGPGKGQTWSYDPAANRWTKLNPTGTSPPARGLASLVYCPELHRLVLFGGRAWSSGSATVTPLNDTWAYDPGVNAWTALSPAGEPPPARFGQAMTYVPSLGKVVLFGGMHWVEGAPEMLGDTWAYDPVANAWTDLAPPGDSPPGRFAHSLACDTELTGKVVLFGGMSGAFPALSYLDDGWAYDPDTNTWSALAPEARPSGRAGIGALAYDSARAKLVLFGGEAPGSGRPWSQMGDTWVYAP
jgi:N-acetylneuraminic acid mutarotase